MSSSDTNVRQDSRLGDGVEAATVNSIISSPLGLSERLPPSNLQAEQALLGAILSNNRAYERVSEFLAPEHFVDPIHGRIYQTIVRRIEAGQLADAVTMKAADVGKPIFKWLCGGAGTTVDKKFLPGSCKG